MAPFTLEDRVLPSYVVPDSPVRECPLCPPWVECAHFGDLAVHMYFGNAYADLPCTNEHYGRGLWKVVGPGTLISSPALAVCSHWVGRHCISGDGPEFFTEDEARAEFERRVVLMLGREEAE